VSTHDTDRDYPVVDRVRDDDDDERGREDGVFDPRDEDDVDEIDDVDDDGLDDDDAPAHRADTPVDAVPGESDPAGPGDPLPGDGLAADDPDRPADDDDLLLADETTVMAVEDAPAQDPTLATVPPAVDDGGAEPAEAPGADTTAGPPVEAIPVPVPAPDGLTADRAEDFGDAGHTGGSEEYEAAWRDLQVMFVDDPAAAVRGAAELLERAVADLRASLEGSDATEDLRTAFRRYRDVFRSLH